MPSQKSATRFSVALGSTNQQEDWLPARISKRTLFHAAQRAAQPPFGYCGRHRHGSLKKLVRPGSKDGRMRSPVPMPRCLRRVIVGGEGLPSFSGWTFYGRHAVKADFVCLKQDAA